MNLAETQQSHLQKILATVLLEKEKQVARQRIHQRSEGRPEQQPLSWAVESHTEIRDLAVCLNGGRKVLKLPMTLRMRVGTPRVPSKRHI